MKINFIVPCYNSEDTLGKSIKSILEQKTEVEIEIIIVDDNSTDNSLAIANLIKKDFSNVKIIHNKVNRGEAEALNIGLDNSPGDFIAIVESDVELEANWLHKILDEFGNNKIMGVGGRLVTPLSDRWIARLAGYETEYKFEKKEKFTNHITSANAVYRKNAFKIVGRFNELLLNASFDADFNLRLIKRGYKLVYTKEAIAYHHFKQSFLEYLKRQYAYARFRPYLEGNLYEKDRLFNVQFILFGLFIILIFLLIFFVKTPIFLPLLIIIGILITIFMGIQIRLILIYRRKDYALLFYPAVSVIKNAVWLVGYTIGLIKKHVK